MRDTPIDRLIRDSLSAEARSHENLCLNENQMAAYLESRLTPQEKCEFESHVVECENCQRVLAMSIKLQEEGDGDLKIAAPSRKTAFRMYVPVPAIGALVIAALLVSLFFRMQSNSDRIAVEKSVELRPPVQPAIPAPTIVPLNKARTESLPRETKAKEEILMAENKQFRASNAAPPADPWNLNGANPGTGVDSKKDAGTSDVGSAVPAAPPPVSGISGNTPSWTPDDLPASQPGTSRVKAFADIPASALNNSAGMEDVHAATEKRKVDSAVHDESSVPIAPARTQQPFARPGIYAASNRIATTMYETESLESTLRFAIRDLNSKLKSAESKQIGDKVFYKNLGYWIDAQCADHGEGPIVEIQSGAPQYKIIMQKYPDIQPPAILYWDGKNYVLSK